MDISSAPNFMESLANYHLGELPTAIHVGSVNQKKADSIFYASIDGRIAMLYPF
jgi:hypothetical protein